jgi:predicted TPR repeat methyltransferase
MEGGRLLVSVRRENPAVDGKVTREHYDRLAAAYDGNWVHSPDFVAWMTGQILRRLRVGGDAVVADGGCGTGLFARATVHKDRHTSDCLGGDPLARHADHPVRA